MKASMADSSTASGPGDWAQVWSGVPAKVMVPIGIELVARVKPWDTSSGGAGTAGGVTAGVAVSVPGGAPAVPSTPLSVAVTRYRSGVNHKALVGQQVTSSRVGPGVLYTGVPAVTILLPVTVNVRVRHAVSYRTTSPGWSWSMWTK